MTDPPKPRRRFQFRLRTLFVVVTLAAAGCWYLAGQHRLVRERNAVLADKHVVSFYFTKDDAPDFAPDCSIPIVRSWLGDCAVISIVCHREADDQAEALRRLFPEAEVVFK